MQTVKRIVEIDIADCDGNAINAGDVLESIDGERRGVVIQILKEGEKTSLPASYAGDMVIKTSPGTHTISSRYNNWKIVPHNEQTYEERYTVWLHSDEEPYYEGEVTREEAIAIQGIMELLPDNVVDWDNGPWPDRLEDAISFLVDHLTSISDKPQEDKDHVA